MARQVIATENLVQRIPESAFGDSRLVHFPTHFTRMLPGDIRFLRVIDNLL